MSIESKLLGTNVVDFRTRQAVVFDWHDGPYEGVCALEYPSCEFVFTCIGERFNGAGMDWRLFSIKGLPGGTVDNILSIIRSLGAPTGPVWVPVWKFPTEEERMEADSSIDQLLKSSRTTPIVICSQDLETYIGCIDLVETPVDADDVFNAFGVPETAE